MITVSKMRVLPPLLQKNDLHVVGASYKLFYMSVLKIPYCFKVMIFTESDHTV